MIAGAVLLDLDGRAVQRADHVVAAVDAGVDRGVIDDAIAGDGGLAHVPHGRGVAWEDGVVGAVQPSAMAPLRLTSA